MKHMYRSVMLIVTMLLIQKTSAQSDLNTLKNRLAEKQEQFEKFITATDTDGINVGHITSILAKIQELEQQAEIAPLLAKIARLRAHACELQTTTPELQKLREQQIKLIDQLEQRTESVRKKIDQLTQFTESGAKKDDAKHKKATAELNNLQKKLTETAQPYTEKIKRINQEIYQHPAIRELFTQTQLIGSEIKKKYTAISDKLEPLNKELMDAVKMVNKKLALQENVMTKLRKDMQSIDQQLFTLDPCFRTKEATSSKSNFLELFL